MFSTVWQKKKNIEDGKPRRKFSLLGPQISSSQIGRKIVWRKRKRRGGDRDNVCGGGDSIGKKNKKTKTKTKTKTYGCNGKIEKRNNIKNKKS